MSFDKLRGLTLLFSTNKDVPVDSNDFKGLVNTDIEPLLLTSGRQ